MEIFRVKNYIFMVNTGDAEPDFAECDAIFTGLFNEKRWVVRCFSKEVHEFLNFLVYYDWSECREGYISPFLSDEKLEGMEGWLKDIFSLLESVDVSFSVFHGWKNGDETARNMLWMSVVNYIKIRWQNNGILPVEELADVVFLKIERRKNELVWRGERAFFQYVDRTVRSILVDVERKERLQCEILEKPDVFGIPRTAYFPPDMLLRMEEWERDFLNFLNTMPFSLQKMGKSSTRAVFEEGIWDEKEIRCYVKGKTGVRSEKFRVQLHRLRKRMKHRYMRRGGGI
ncbi:hypothetical protein DRQ18_00040 [bacterium]|nr:MAG: hypothetical protein DRQ18_00040 [bacterium]